MASKGGFDFTALYTMPLFLRRFYFKQMDEYIIKKNEEIESSTGKVKTHTGLVGPMGRPLK